MKKSTTTLALVSLVAAVSGAIFTPAAQAQSGEQLSSPDYSHLQSLRSRADVQAEAVAANRSGLLGWSGYQTAIPFNNRFVSTKSRADVAAETAEAIRQGLVAHSGEYGPAISAAEVTRAERARHARASTATALRAE
jgi:hypothetical protein